MPLQTPLSPLSLPTDHSPYSTGEGSSARPLPSREQPQPASFTTADTSDSTTQPSHLAPAPTPIPTTSTRSALPTRPESTAVPRLALHSTTTTQLRKVARLGLKPSREQPQPDTTTTTPRHLRLHHPNTRSTPLWKKARPGRCPRESSPNQATSPPPTPPTRPYDTRT